MESKDVVRATLAGEAASASLARDLVGETAAHWCETDMVETARLLTSELVTNVVLHAGTDIDLLVEPSLGGVHVEVGDHASARPIPKHYSADASTGRGMLLLDMLAARWGVREHPGGKVVWFELSEEEGVEREVVARLDDWPELEEVEGLHHVELLDVPVGTYRRMQEHTDGLVREFTLALESGEEHATPVKLVTLMEDIKLESGKVGDGPSQQVARAEAAGAPTVDIHYKVPALAAEITAQMLTLFEEADEYCRAGALLMLSTPADVDALRHWVLDEFVRQIAGEEPRPWRA